jgi:SnoaL-like domain
MSTEEKNRALVCRFLEAQSEGDLEALDELLAPDFVDHGLLPGHDPGREGFMQGVAEANAALSLIRTTIEYQGTDGDDMVITRHTTHTIHDRGAPCGLMRRSSTKWSRNRTWVFRSKCATLLLSKSVHVTLVQELLRHSTIGVTLDTYSHVLPGMGDGLADTMDETLG